MSHRACHGVMFADFYKNKKKQIKIWIIKWKCLSLQPIY